MKENECKEKRRYGWCASKEKNTDAAWEVSGEQRHNGVYHHTRPQHLVNRARHDLGPPRRRAPPQIGGCSSTCPPTPTPD